MTKAELESNHLSELHALAAEAEDPRYRMLRREELVEKLLDPKPARGETAERRERQRSPRRRRARPEREPAERERPAGEEPAAGSAEAGRPERRRRRPRFGRRDKGLRPH